MPTLASASNASLRAEQGKAHGRGAVTGRESGVWVAGEAARKDKEDMLEDLNRAVAMQQAYQRESEARREDARVFDAARDDWARSAHGTLRDVDNLAGALNALVSDAESAARLGAMLSAEDMRVRLLHLRALLQPVGSGVSRLASDVAVPVKTVGRRHA